MTHPAAREGQWTALLLAGSRPGGDPFAADFGTDLKPLILLGGRPLVAWPAAALLASAEVARVRVLTQAVDRIAAVLPEDARMTVEPSGATIAATLEAIINDPATRFPVLVTTADHALLDTAIIADFCAKADGADLAIGLVERGKLMERLSGTKRTWLRFRGGAYSGANLFAFGNARAARAVALWRSVEQDRKTGWRLLAALGPLTLLGALLRLKTIDQVITAVSGRLQIDIRKVELANPLAAVDVDKPADHELVSAILGGRA